jgi:NAD(P)-dependent dehydrogenase (short-subunit alcohol dehydrogenase family)
MTAASVAPDPDGYACYPSLRGRVVFVTGGATGIGAAFVAEFARQGARVGFVDLQQKPGEDLAAKLGAELGAVVPDLRRE